MILSKIVLFTGLFITLPLLASTPITSNTPYHFTLTDKGIFITPALKERDFLAYPATLKQRNKPLSLHTGVVQGHPTLMLTVANNHLYTLTLDKVWVWHKVKTPGLAEGSYNLHDFLITPFGTYYLATSNGLYYSHLNSTLPYRPQLTQWQFKNDFPDANLKRLYTTYNRHTKQATICALSLGASYCLDPSGQWHTVVTHPFLHHASAQGTAPLGRKIIMDAHFAQQSEKPALYGNGNQQLPLYITVCPAPGDTTPISEKDISLIKQYLAIKDADNNQAIGLEKESNGALYTYTKNSFALGTLGSPSYAFSAARLGDSGACPDPALKKVITLYLQSDTLNPAKRIYALLNYTDAYQHIQTASTFDSSSNTVFKIIPPIAYSRDNVNEHMVCQYDSIWTTLGDYYDYTEYSFKSAGSIQSAPILKGAIRSWDYGGNAGMGRGTGDVSWSCKVNGQSCHIDETYHFTRKPNWFYQTRYGDIFLVNNGGHDQHNIDFNITSDGHSVDYHLDNPYVYLLSDSYVYYGSSARPGIDLYNFVIHLTDIYGNGFDYTKGIYTLSCGS